jgi:DNA topoisomerase-6 subunit B
MFKGVRAEFYAASSREANVYRGRPFLIETAIAFGGELPSDEPARVIRFANRVPLLFQQSACSSFKAVTETNWRNYDLQHPRGAVPVGALVIMIHMASVWVPFTSESKEAIADYDEIRKEMKLALMECGRKLGAYLRKRAKMKREGQRRDVFERYIGEISKAINAINGVDMKELYDKLLIQARKRTAIADAQLDDEGRAVKEDPADQEGVIVVEAAAVPERHEAPSPIADPKPAASTSGGSRSSKGASKQAQESKPAAKKQRMLGEDLSDIPGAGTKASKAEAAALAVNAAQRTGEAMAKPAGQTPAGQKTPKPRMRVVDGKMVRVDEPGLF